ncbi:dnaJ homolog subfamily C member 28 isoform X1 [Centruroides vittatus]|uniref:dnaJ homolog subfamily C member 28 isoform X1 n=1 Tax=Centruroides vittatus TaxID=120091 RepID=UPI00350F5DF3
MHVLDSQKKMQLIALVRTRPISFLLINKLVRFSSSKTKKELIESCRMLEISQTPTADELKEAFLRLAKKYHPDGGAPTADADRFAEVQAAYKIVRENLAELNCENDEQLLEKNFGIKHTVPQHRRYLSNEGVGYGSPSQRQKQYRQHKMNKAVENVFEYRSNKLASQSENSVFVKDASLARQYKTRQAMERLVEDLIQESIARGEFDNLPGSGKPLNYVPENPYVDSMTHKLNQILINNGFTPEWIVLEQEIKKEKTEIRTLLENQRSRLGPHPISENEKCQWRNIILNSQPKVKSLNIKIDKYNMIVPITTKQQLHFQLEKEAEKILRCGKTGMSVSSKNQEKHSQSMPENALDAFWNLFR